MTNSKVQSTVQLLTFSLLIGLTTGLVTAIFGQVLLEIGWIRSRFFPYLIPFLPIAGLVIVFAYQTWGKAVQAGMSLIFQAGQGQTDKIPPILLPLISLTTWLSHLFGASVGREGVAVQLGAGVAHFLASAFSKAIPKSTITKIGMAAGFAGLFQTPLAASFFAIEVLIVGNYDLASLSYCLLAAFTASTTSHLLGLEKFSHSIASYSIPLSDSYKFFILAICFASIGNLFAWLLAQTKRHLQAAFPNPYMKILCSGLALSFLLYSAHQGRYAGLGTNLIESSLDGGTILAYDWLIKLVLTCLCLAAGFQGGEVTPLFAIGTSAGAVLAGLLGLPPELCLALGYCAVFSSATNTFLAPLFISYEVFGIHSIPYALPVLFLASIMNRKQTIYPQQITK